MPMDGMLCVLDILMLILVQDRMIFGDFSVNSEPILAKLY